MKRWVACKKVLVDGAYEPAVNRHTDNSRCWSAEGVNWMFCQVGVRDLTALSADPDCHVLPDVSMDLKVSDIPLATRNNMKTKLEALGVTDYSAIKGTWTIRQLLRWLGGQLQARMDPEAGDVADF